MPEIVLLPILLRVPRMFSSLFEASKEELIGMNVQPSVQPTAVTAFQLQEGGFHGVALQEANRQRLIVNDCARHRPRRCHR